MAGGPDFSAYIAYADLDRYLLSRQIAISRHDGELELESEVDFQQQD